MVLEPAIRGDNLTWGGGGILSCDTGIAQINLVQYIDMVDRVTRSGFSGFSTDTDRATRDDIWNAGLAYFLTVPREGDNGAVHAGSVLYCNVQQRETI